MQNVCIASFLELLCFAHCIFRMCRMWWNSMLSIGQNKQFLNWISNMYWWGFVIERFDWRIFLLPAIRILEKSGYTGKVNQHCTFFFWVFFFSLLFFSPNSPDTTGNPFLFKNFNQSEKKNISDLQRKIQNSRATDFENGAVHSVKSIKKKKKNSFAVICFPVIESFIPRLRTMKSLSNSAD